MQVSALRSWGSKREASMAYTGSPSLKGRKEECVQRGKDRRRIFGVGLRECAWLAVPLSCGIMLVFLQKHMSDPKGSQTYSIKGLGPQEERRVSGKRDLNA